MPDTIAAALVAGFLGVLVGGIVTYLAASAIETQKWKQQRKDRRLDDVRSALRKAAEWIAPIEFALARAQAASGLPDERWLGFVSELAALQGSMPDSFLLPPDLQNVNSLIAQQLARLQMDDERASREQTLQILAGIRKLTTEFRRVVRDAYNATYE